jgi:hypothetical protein
MKVTRNGIYYKLKESPYHVTLCGMTYYFSSRFYRTKFAEFIDSNRVDINQSLSKRFKMDINLPVLCDLVLYSKTEKRGFFVTTEEGGELAWPISLRYAGGRVTVTTLTRKSDGSIQS